MSTPRRRYVPAAIAARDGWNCPMKIAVAGEFRRLIEIRDGLGVLIGRAHADPTGEATAVVDWEVHALNHPARRRMIEGGQFTAWVGADGVVDALSISTKRMR